MEYDLDAEKHDDGFLLLTHKIELQKNILAFLSTYSVPSRPVFLRAF